jgi:hypothetical protein
MLNVDPRGTAERWAVDVGSAVGQVGGGVSGATGAIASLGQTVEQAGQFIKKYWYVAIPVGWFLYNKLKKL